MHAGRSFWRRLWLALSVVLVALTVFYFVRSTRESRHRNPVIAAALTPLNMPAPANPPPLSACVVYEWNGGLYSTLIRSGLTRKIAAQGSFPRWSPDGRSLAYWRGKTLVQARADGSNPVALTEAKAPHGIAYHPDGLELFFVDGDVVKSVTLSSAAVRTRLEGHPFREIDLAPGERFVASIQSVPNHYILAIDLSTGRKWKLGPVGCSASLSPDGQFSTRNSWDHRRLFIDEWATNHEIRSLPAPRSQLNDDQNWSNHPDWVVSVMKGRSTEIYITRVSDAQFWRVTFCGGCGRPDLFVPPSDQRY